ncbi:MAG: hypothetical protein ABSC49_00980 [Candidatus Microgenomates bacterium]|jgi:hypothetical protein
MKKLVILFFAFSVIIYFFTSAGHTPYDYFTRLSDAFLAGKNYVTENPPWLSELIPGGSGKYYVAYPPMPAILALPFRFIFGKIFFQEYLSQILGAGIVAFTMLISWKIKKNKRLLIWVGILSSLGTITWFLSATGSSWYLGQVSATFFLTLAIWKGIDRKNPFLVGLFLGAAYLSRLQIILSLPLFLYLFSGKNWFKKYFLLALGISPFAFFDFYYNFSRFGTIIDKGYFLIPGVLQEPWFSKGLFNPVYIPRNLKVIFTALPRFSNKFPFVTPSWAGLAIWATTPAFIYALWADIKERITQFSWISILLISLLIFSHGSTGFAQFGYRFAVDFYPILTFLTIKGVAKTDIRWYHWLFLFIGVLVNAWGVIFINKFGWVGF